LGPYGSKPSKEKYNRLLAEYFASGQSKSFGAELEGFTVAQLLAAYSAYVKVTYPNAKKGEGYKIRLAVRPLKRLYASLDAKGFGVPQWLAVRQYMIDGKNGAEGRPIVKPSRNHVNELMQRVTRLFRWAAGDGNLLPGSIADSLERIEPLKQGRTTAPETEGVGVVSDAIVEATLPHLPAVVRDMVKLQRLLGCRPGELCQLTPAMIDRTTGAEWEVTIMKHKTMLKGKQRFFFVGPKAQDVMLPYLLRGENDCLFCPKESERKRREALHQERVTPTSCGNVPGSNRAKKPLVSAGKCYTSGSYARAIQRACEAQGIERWTPNQLRHSALTEVERMMGMEAASAVAGHSNLSTTQIYVERDKNRSREAARRMG